MATTHLHLLAMRMENGPTPANMSRTTSVGPTRLAILSLSVPRRGVK